jgi:hypothetical protein
MHLLTAVVCVIRAFLYLLYTFLQYFQVLLHRYPNWRAELAGISSSASSTSSTDLATAAATAAAGDASTAAGTDTAGTMPTASGSAADTAAAQSATRSSSTGGSGHVHVHVTINHDSSGSSATATDTTIAGTRSGATANDDAAQRGQQQRQQLQCVRRRGARRSVRMALHFALMGCLAFTGKPAMLKYRTV